MCGIAGLIDEGATRDRLAMVAEKMVGALYHRGPDDKGIWISPSVPLAMSHTRLSVIDTSQAARQPMTSSDRRLSLVFNGEIYNFRSLRKQLSHLGAHFGSASDTEVALRAIETWGIEKALKSFEGMFALALWDESARRLTLARDRVGEKPLYYGFLGRKFAFSSELKAFRKIDDWHPDIDFDAVGSLIHLGYIKAPLSIYKGVKKLLPGTFLEFTFGDHGGHIQPKYYWDLCGIVANRRLDGSGDREQRATAAELESLLGDVVKDQMVADVPVGAFLSGGIDSSLITALMCQQTSSAVKTFSIGFHESAYDEAPYARDVANHLQTVHTELYVTATEAQAVIPLLPEIYDEPFADSSQIPTFLISKLCRQQVTVALSGDGGDEIFGGYNRYQLGQKILGSVNRVPQPFRKACASAIKSIKPQSWDLINRRLRFLLPDRLRYEQLGYKAHKFASIWGSADTESIYRQIVELWEGSSSVLRRPHRYSFLENYRKDFASIGSFQEQMMFADFLTYLPDDILTKVDRAAMSVSLETRAPFLNHKVVEFMWNQAPKAKINGGNTKVLLREILAKYVPKSLTDRPKMGFGVPIDQWLRGPLRDWAGDLLAEQRLRSDAIFDSRMVQKAWNDHLDQKASNQYLLWPVLMFQAWHDRWVD